MSDQQFKPDPSKHYVIGFSGGKDSVATWAYLTRELRLPNVTCTFADTGHEASVLHEYLDLLDREHGLNCVRLKPTLADMAGELNPRKMAVRLHSWNLVKANRLNEVAMLNLRIADQDEADLADELGLDYESEEFWNTPLDMELMSVVKRRFPSPTVRFCTDHLKLRPQSRWLKENCDVGNTVRVSGVRSQESPSRAARSDYVENDPVFGCPLWLPIKEWTHEQVFALHDKYGIPPNPLYKEGVGRVGCFPCIMARKQELVQIGKRFPDEAFGKLSEMERRVALAVGKPVMSFFSNSKTPKRFHSHLCPQSGETFPDAEDVRRWALREEPANSQQSMMFEEDWTEDAHQCLSQYGLCE